MPQIPEEVRSFVGGQRCGIPLRPIPGRAAPRHTAVGVAARDEETVPAVHLHEAVLDVPIVGVGIARVGSVDVDPVVTKSFYGQGYPVAMERKVALSDLQLFMSFLRVAERAQLAP